MLAIYARLSREDEESTSIQNQLREGVEFAQTNGFDKYEIYNEGEGVSGTWEIDKRPQLFQLIQDIKKRKYKAVWFRNQNRLGRNMDTYIVFINVCVKSETKIFFDNKEFDYTDPTEDLIGNVISALNSYTTKLQSKQTKKALLDNVKEGKAHSVIAYGYTTDDNGYLIVDEKESEIVKRMFDEHSKGKGCNKIAEELNNEGVPTRYSKLKNKTSGKWHDKTVRDILRNTIYYGKRNWGGKMYDAPIIVSKDTWDKSIEAFIKNQNTRGKKVEHKYLLNGILKCSVCGRGMYGRRRVSGKDNAYTCAGKRKKGNEKCPNRSLNIDALEDFIWNRFFVVERFVELVKQAVKDNNENGKQTELESDIARINVASEKLHKEKNNAIRLAIKGLIDDDDIQSEIKRIEDKIRELEERKKKVEENLEFIITAKKQYESVENEIKLLKNNTPFNTKRKIIHRYIKNIHLMSFTQNHYINIEFHMPIKVESYVRFNGKFYDINNYESKEIKNIINKEGIYFFER